MKRWSINAISCVSSLGGEFLLQWVKVEGENRCYFAVTEDGRPVKLQRKPYTECFYTMAMAELHRATREKKYQVRGRKFSTNLSLHCVEPSSH